MLEILRILALFVATGVLVIFSICFLGSFLVDWYEGKSYKLDLVLFLVFGTLAFLVFTIFVNSNS